MSKVFFLSIVAIAQLVWAAEDFITYPELDPAECGTTQVCSYRFIETETDFYFHDDFHEGLVPVIVEDKRPLGKGLWGYMNRSGELAIPDTYELAQGFSEGLAAVKRHGRWGYIDREGTMVIEPQYYSAAPFSEGLAAVRIDGFESFIDKSGRPAFDETFSQVYSFVEGRAWVRDRNSRRWGYIDRTGKYAVPAIYGYDYARNFPFNQGLAPVKLRGGNYIFIDPDGNQAFDKIFAGAQGFRNDRALVFTGPDRKQVFIDIQGNEVVDLSDYGHVHDFRDSRALVSVDRSHFYIDPQGTKVTDTIDTSGVRTEVYCPTWDYNQGLAAATDTNGRWGYINAGGNWIIDPVFFEASSFSEGTARVVVVDEDDYDWRFIEIVAEKPTGR